MNKRTFERRIVGVDVSKDTLDAFFEDKKEFSCCFPNNHLGFKQLLKWCKKPGAELFICMEATGSYSLDLAEFLHANGIKVFVENARLIKAFRESENLRNSTDKIDAKNIANYATSKLHKMREWRPMPDYLKKLRELVRLRQALVESRTMWTNRNGSKSLKGVSQYLKEIVDKLRNSIKQIDKEIKNHIASTPRLKHEIKLLCSIKGIGRLTAATILAEIPQIEFFEDKQDLVAFAGLNPALRRSGTSIDFKPMLSKKGSGRIRKALYMPAVVALKHNPRIREFAKRLTKKGKHSMSIVGAVMRRLLCFVFGVLRSNEPFRIEQVNTNCSRKAA